MSYVRKVTPFFVDDRGEMSFLLNDEIHFTSALYITCNKGSIRANHYHKKDTHFTFLQKGKMEYYYKENEKGKVKKEIVNAGEIVETPPGVWHAMKFLEKSIFVALTTESRDQEKYEADTVKVKLI